MASTNPFTRATKHQLKARLALAGPTGAGKSWSALEWATVLADGAPIAVVDTERNSASLYADHFEFDSLDMAPPYDPQRCVEALRSAEQNGYAVAVVDSLTHFWQGEGGTLDIVEGAARRDFGGNQYAGWSVGTPALRHLVDTMLSVDMHLIVTMRSKMEYVEVIKNGRKTYERVGMAPVMRAGIEYEFQVLGDVDLEHRIVITKSRCDILSDTIVQPGRAGDAAATFKAWLEDGDPTPAPAAQTATMVPRVQAQKEVLALADGDKVVARDVWDRWFAGGDDTLTRVELDDRLAKIATHLGQVGESSAPDGPGAVANHVAGDTQATPDGAGMAAAPKGATTVASGPDSAPAGPDATHTGTPQGAYFARHTEAAAAAGCDTDELRRRLMLAATAGETDSAAGCGSHDPVWSVLCDLAGRVIGGEELWRNGNGGWRVGRRPA